MKKCKIYRFLFCGTIHFSYIYLKEYDTISQSTRVIPHVGVPHSCYRPYFRESRPVFLRIFVEFQVIRYEKSYREGVKSVKIQIRLYVAVQLQTLPTAHQVDSVLFLLKIVNIIIISLSLHP